MVCARALIYSFIRTIHMNKISPIDLHTMPKNRKYFTYKACTKTAEKETRKAEKREKSTRTQIKTMHSRLILINGNDVKELAMLTPNSRRQQQRRRRTKIYIVQVKTIEDAKAHILFVWLDGLICEFFVKFCHIRQRTVSHAMV